MKPLKQITFKSIPVIIKPLIQQPQKAKESILKLLVQCAAVELALRYRLSLMDRWWDTLPQIPGNASWNIFDNVLKDYTYNASKTSLKDHLEPPKSKFNWFGKVPPEILRL